MPAQPAFKSPAGRDAILAAYGRLLDAWPVPVERRVLPTPLGDTFALACGDPSAPPLVLLHGSSSNSAIWAGDVVEFIRAYRVYCLDIPGEPGKSAPARPALNSPAYAEWFQAALDGLGVQQCALMGISLGGWLALKYSVTNPARVSKLVLECPSGVAIQRRDFFLKALPLMLMGRRGTEGMVRLLTAGQSLPAEVVDYMHLISTAFNPRIETIPLFTDEELRCLTMPVLLIVGEKDVMLPSQQTADRLRALLPNLEAHVLPGVGHVITGQAGRIMGFLAGNP